MAVTSTDLLMIERGGTLYKAPVSELPSGGGGAAGLVLLQQETITTAVSAVDLDLPSGYSRFRLIGQQLTRNGGYSGVDLSTDGGATFLSDSAVFRTFSRDMGSNTTVAGGSTDTKTIELQTNEDQNVFCSYDIVSVATRFAIHGQSNGQDISDSKWWGTIAWGARVVTSRVDLIRYKGFSNNFTAGTLSLYGYKESV